MFYSFYTRLELFHILKTKKLFYLNEIANSGVKKEAGLYIVAQLLNGVFKDGAWIYTVGKSRQLNKTSAAFTANPVSKKNVITSIDNKCEV